jgi:hypothetical protein
MINFCLGMRHRCPTPLTLIVITGKDSGTEIKHPQPFFPAGPVRLSRQIFPEK